MKNSKDAPKGEKEVRLPYYTASMCCIIKTASFWYTDGHNGAKEQSRSPGNRSNHMQKSDCTSASSVYH